MVTQDTSGVSLRTVERHLCARHPPDLGSAHQVCHPVADGRLTEPVRHDVETVGHVRVASDVIGDELSKVVRRQPDAFEDQVELDVAGQPAPDKIESLIDRAGIRIGHDKSIDLIEHDATLDQPGQHLGLLTRTGRDIDQTKIDEGSDIGMHDDLPVDNREDPIEGRRLGRGRGRHEDRHDPHTDTQPADDPAFKRPGRY